MSHKVQFLPEARDQLDALEDYIAGAASPLIAVRHVDAIMEYCEDLRSFPQRGTMRDDLLPGLRITNYRRSAVVAFLVDAATETVSIVGVFYGGQNYEGRLQGDFPE